MLRKRRDEPVARLTTGIEAEAQALRDLCALASLAHIRDILAAYDGVPALLEGEGIDDRAVDLWSPLIAVGLVADGEDHGTRTGQLLEVARELSSVRDADAETGQTARLLEALDAIRAERGETPTPGQLLEALRARPGWEWLGSPRRLAGLLNPLGLYRRQLWDGQRRRWCYVLTPDELADLRARFGSAIEPGEALP